MCVCSPPYWGLRDYGTEGQIGLEPTPEAFVATMVEVFREVRRMLRKDGTLWLNLGDSYAGSGPSGASYESATTKRRREQGAQDGSFRVSPTLRDRGLTYAEKKPIPPPGLKAKDLCMIPARVALALQADGWYLRSEITWCKPNPMPESVTDRPTQATEKVYLLSKSARYFYDAEAVREPYKYDGRKVTHVEGGEGSLQHRSGERWPGLRSNPSWEERKAAGATSANRELENVEKKTVHGEGLSHDLSNPNVAGRNLRNWWEIATEPYPDAHFATYPQELVRRCILAGSAEGDVVLDPFGGSGTTAYVARKLARRSILVELSESYCELAARRTHQLSLEAEVA